MNSLVSEDLPHSGDLSLRNTAGSAGSNSVTFTYNGVNFCTGTIMRFWVYIADPFTAAPFNFQLAGSIGPWATMRVMPTGSVELDTIATGATVLEDTWYQFNFYRIYVSGTNFCDGTNHNAQSCISSPTLGLNKCNTAGNSNQNGNANSFSAIWDGAGTQVIYLDDMGPLQSYSTASQNNIFCANVIEDDTTTGAGDHPNYGYNYRRGGAYFNQEDGDVAGIGLSTGYKFEGDSSEANWDYTAKDFSTGTKAVHANLTLEAQFTSGDPTSVYRVNFMTVSGANSDATTKGNGLNTGLFSDHAEVQFLEAGSSWQVSFWYVTGGGTRTQIGAAAAVGGAHDATPFTIWMDNRGSANGPPEAGFAGTGGTITAGPYIAVTIPQASTGGDPNTIVGFRSLPAAFLEDTIFNVWNVGYGSAATAITAVDENIQVGDNTDDEGAAIGNDSTCIFDDVGTAVARGSQGSAPDSTVPDFTPTPTGSSTGTSSQQLPLGVDPTAGANAMGVSEAAYSAYLGIMYTLAIGVVFAIPAVIVVVKFQKSLVIVAWAFLAGVVFGFILTAVWGFYQAWMVFAVVLAMILAVIGLIVLGRRGG